MKQYNNNHKGYQSYGPVNQGQPAQDQWAGAPQQGGILENQYGDPTLTHDLSNPAVVAFTKKVYAYFASALATSTVAAFAGVQVTEHYATLAAAGDASAMSAFGTIRIVSLVAFFASFLAVIFMRNVQS
ncbi:MAG: hypothetical protein ACYTDT_13040, partial [Planctomycetota bacterium]